MSSSNRQLLFLPLIVAFACLGAGVAQAQTYSRAAVSGKAAWMDDYYGWDNNCQSKVIDIDVVDPPSHGTVRPQPKNGRIPQAQIGSARHCLGKPFKGWSLFYTSSRGYKGPDSFRVRMGVGGQSKFFVYNVNVR